MPQDCQASTPDLIPTQMESVIPARTRTAPTIEAKVGSTDYTREAFLKFNISAVPSVGSARLRVFGALADARSVNIPLTAFAVPGTGWSETALTWNTRPARGTQVGTTRVVDAVQRWYEFDVSGFVRAEKAAGRPVVSFSLAAALASSPHIFFSSREAAANRPELVVGEAAIAAAPEVVLYASDATVVNGTWRRVSDPQAAGGVRLSQPDAGTPKITTPAAAPVNFFELTFDAQAGRPYRLWIRGQAAANAYANDSAFVQFSGTVTASGTPTTRIGTSSAMTWVLEDCSGCGLSGWGWQDNGYGVNVLGPEIFFGATGLQTLRIQTREDGLSIDQVVLSPTRYRTTAPGRATNDTTILPK